MKYIVFAFVLLSGFITSCGQKGANPENGNNEVVAITSDYAEDTVADKDMVIDILDAARREMLYTHLISGVSVSQSNDTIFLNYNENLVLTDSIKTSNDTLLVSVMNSGGIEVIPRYVKKVSTKIEAKEEQGIKYLKYACYIASAIVIGLAVLIFVKRPKKRFKISDKPKLYQYHNKIKGKSKQTGKTRSKEKSDNAIYGLKMSWRDDRISDDKVKDWLIRNYYRENSEAKILQIKEKIDTLTTENSPYFRTIVIPLRVVEKPEGNRNSWSQYYYEVKSKDKKGKRWFMRVPDDIQNFKFSDDTVADEESASEDSLVDEYFKFVTEKLINLVEKKELEQSIYDRHAETKNTILKRLESVKEIESLKKRVSQLESDLSQEKNITAAEVKKATDAILREKEQVESDKEELSNKLNNLKVTCADLQRECDSIKSEKDRLTSELANSRKYFAYRGECSEFAQKLEEFFSLIVKMENGADKLILQFASEGTWDALKEIEDSISQYRKQVEKCKDVMSIKYNSSLISDTGFCLVGSDLDTRLQSQTNQAARPEDYRYYVYEKLGRMMGASVKVADIIKHLNVSQGISEELLKEFADMPQRLIAAIAALGYEVNFVELYTPASDYQEIDIIDYTRKDGFEPNTVMAVNSMAVKYGTSSPKTEVTTQES